MNFFGIGYGEVLIIVVAALIIFGPQRLPEVAGQAARWIRDARKMMADLSGEFERNAGVREFKDAIEGEIKGIKGELEGAGLSVKNDLNAAAGTANKAFSSAAKTAKGTTGAKPKTGTSTTAKATGSKPAASSTTKAGRPKPTKEDPYAGLVQLAEVKPKSSRVAAAVSNGDGPLVDTSSQPSREVSEAIMRARERRLSAGYNRRAVSQ